MTAMTAPAAPRPASASASAQLVIRRADTNDQYRRAVQTPEHERALQLHARAIQKRAELEPIPPAPMPTSPDDDLDDWLRLVERLGELKRGRTVKRNALTALITSAENRIQSVVHQKDRTLTSLARDLDEIMAAAAQVVERLDGARNPAQAIERGVAGAWQELTPLRNEYDSVR